MGLLFTIQGYALSGSDESVYVAANTRTPTPSIEFDPEARHPATPTRTPSRPTPMPTPRWIYVNLEDMLQTYADNPIAGHQQFADKLLEVTGRIGRPDYAPFSDKQFYAIPMYSNEEFSMLVLNCIMPVNADNTAWIVGLLEGDVWVFHGYIRDDMEFGSLDLEECTPVGFYERESNPPTPTPDTGPVVTRGLTPTPTPSRPTPTPDTGPASGRRFMPTILTIKDLWAEHPPELTVRPNDILQTYLGNAIAGHQQWADKLLTVYGTGDIPEYVSSFNGKQAYVLPIYMFVGRHLSGDEGFSWYSLNCIMPVNADTTAWLTVLDRQADVNGGRRPQVMVSGYIRDWGDRSVTLNEDLNYGRGRLDLDLEECILLYVIGGELTPTSTPSRPTPTPSRPTPTPSRPTPTPDTGPVVRGLMPTSSTIMDLWVAHPPELNVMTYDILQAYVDNAIAAHQQFGDKLLTVLGTGGIPEYGSPLRKHWGDTDNGKQTYVIPIYPVWLDGYGEFALWFLNCITPVGPYTTDWLTVADRAAVVDGMRPNVLVSGYIRDMDDWSETLKRDSENDNFNYGSLDLEECILLYVWD